MAGKLIDLKGLRFGRLTVKEQVLEKTEKYNGPIWLCTCDCGTEVKVLGSNLRNGYTQSCGCLQKERVTNHGMRHLPEYRIWQGMLSRCHTPSGSGYEKYGAKGITVCDEWRKSFETFYRDMGPRPSGKHSIERKKNELGYSKENCRWATAAEQANNKTSNIFFTYNGVSKTLMAWSKELGFDYQTVYRKVKAGIPFEEVIKNLK